MMNDKQIENIVDKIYNVVVDNDPSIEDVVFAVSSGLMKVHKRNLILTDSGKQLIENEPLGKLEFDLLDIYSIAYDAGYPAKLSENEKDVIASLMNKELLQSNSHGYYDTTLKGNIALTKMYIQRWLTPTIDKTSDDRL
jgi:predicted transcriptional regulator